MQCNCDNKCSLAPYLVLKAKGIPLDSEKSLSDFTVNNDTALTPSQIHDLVGHTLYMANPTIKAIGRDRYFGYL